MVQCVPQENEDEEDVTLVNTCQDNGVLTHKTTTQQYKWSLL
jgi:hypothetical protein